MFETKRRGPRTYLCGIPEVTSGQFDSLPFTATFCLLFEMNASIQFTSSLLICILIYLCISLLCGTVSKVLFKVPVYNIWYVWCPLSIS